MREHNASKGLTPCEDSANAQNWFPESECSLSEMLSIGVGQQREGKDAFSTTGKYVRKPRLNPAAFSLGMRPLILPAALGFTAVMALALILVWLMPVPAHSHDWQKPNLDGWYGSLKRPGMSQNGSFGGTFSCCSKTDCHTTEAELRGADWWARVGVQRPSGDWDLRDWVQVPAQAVLEKQDNPTGEAVICHSTAWVNHTDGTQTLNPQWIAIWCFVPPTES